MMLYDWKVPGLYAVDAQVAGEELERIYGERGTLKPDIVVEESRPEDAPLHKCFEWNDEVAAGNWRRHQARNLMCNVVVVSDAGDSPATPTRAYAHVSNDYHPISVVLESRDMTEELLENAYRDMRIFQQKYADLQQLAAVCEAMNVALAA